MSEMTSEEQPAAVEEVPESDAGFVVEAQGDPVGGWIVHVHDGDKAASYSPDAADAVEAVNKAMALHRAAGKVAVTGGAV